MLLQKNSYGPSTVLAPPTADEWDTVVIKYEAANLTVPTDWEALLPADSIPLAANTTFRGLITAISEHYTRPLESPEELAKMRQDAQFVYSYGHQFGLEVLQALDEGKPVRKVDLLGKRAPVTNSQGIRRKHTEFSGVVRFEGISHAATEPCGLPQDLKLELGSSW